MNSFFVFFILFEDYPSKIDYRSDGAAKMMRNDRKIDLWLYLFYQLIFLFSVDNHHELYHNESCKW